MRRIGLHEITRLPINFGAVLSNPIGGSAAFQPDLRQILTASELLAYWDLRPAVSGAQASATMSATLVPSGSTLPTVTLGGPLSPPRQIRIDYQVGGARGTATYRIQLDGGDTVLTGTTGATPVDIGGGNTISFGNDANYTINSNITTATIHESQVVSWAELTGRANCTLTNVHTTFGGRYEAIGLNGVYPSLKWSTSGLANENGVPALVTGNDVAFEMWMLYEIWSMPATNANQVPWAFSHQTDTTKSFIDTGSNGTAVANPRLWFVNRKNSAGTPVTASYVSTVKLDAAPRVMRWVVSSSGQIWSNGRPYKASNTNLATGGTTNLNRLTLGYLKLGTSSIAATTFDPNWQAEHEITISKMVDGFLATFGCKRTPFGVSYTWDDPTQFNNLDWNGQQFITADQIGRGVDYNFYIEPAAATGQQRWAPTGSGSSYDQLPRDITSNVIAQGLNDAAGTSMVRISKPAFWQRGNQDPPLSPGHPCLNKHDLAETIVTQYIGFGLSGNDHIITFDSYVVIPVDPNVQAATVMSFIPLFCYSPNYIALPIFDTQKFVDVVTGATRAFSSGQQSSTEVVMNCKADGSFAIAPVVGPGVLADSGYYTGTSSTGALGFTWSYNFPVKNYPSGIPAGTLRQTAALCFGTEADVVGNSGAIVTAYAGLPSAIYP